jgi:hypothetical protein
MQLFSALILAAAVSASVLIETEEEASIKDLLVKMTTPAFLSMLSKPIVHSESQLKKKSKFIEQIRRFDLTKEKIQLSKSLQARIESALVKV